MDLLAAVEPALEDPAIEANLRQFCLVLSVFAGSSHPIEGLQRTAKYPLYPAALAGGPGSGSFRCSAD